MDPAKQQAIQNCGRCGQPEEAHNHKTGTDEEAIGVLFALGGPCPGFVVSDAAVIYQRHLAVSGWREPQRAPGRVGKRVPLCGRCGQRHRGECVL
jgi:hypothetical protein